MLVVCVEGVRGGEGMESGWWRKKRWVMVPGEEILDFIHGGRRFLSARGSEFG